MGKRARRRGLKPGAAASPPPTVSEYQPQPVSMRQHKCRVLIDMALSAVPSAVGSGLPSVLPGLKIRFVQMPDANPLDFPACIAFERPQHGWEKSKVVVPGGAARDEGRAWGVQPLDPYVSRVLPPSEVQVGSVAAARELAGL